MSRLIDADDFSRVIQDYFKDCIERKKYEVDVVDCNADIQHFLEQQPAAYDVEKVVAELEEVEQSRLEMYDWQGQSAVSDAIDRVKKGGMSNIYTEDNVDNIDKAIEGLNQFTKNWCMNVAETEKGDLTFRCSECEFEDARCKAR